MSRAWIRAIILIATVTTPLRAKTPVGAATIELTMVSPWSSCPSERQLAARIEAELLEMGHDGSSAHTAVRVGISRSGGKFVAQVEVADQPSGQRQLEAPECESLGDALAVAIAVILDGQAALAAKTGNVAVAASNQHQQEESNGNSNAIQPAATTVNDDEAAVSLPHTPLLQASAIRYAGMPPAPRESEPLLRRGGWGFWVGGGISSGTAMLMTAGGELDWLPFKARLGTWWQSQPDLRLAPGTVTRSRLGGMAVGCMAWGRQVRLLACGHAWLGGESFAGRGFEQLRSDTVFWGAAGPGLGLESGQRVRIALDAVALTSFNSDRYVARAAGTEQTSERFALWVLLRVGLSRAFGPQWPLAQ